MLRLRLVRLATCFLGLTLLSLFAFSQPAAGDDIVTVDFTGTTGPCGGANCATMNNPAFTSTVTGTFSFDETTSQIVGPWSFLTTIIGVGLISSNSSGAAATFLAQDPYLAPYGVNLPEFEFLAGGSSDYVRVLLDFNADTFGPLVTSVPGYPYFAPSGIEHEGGQFFFTSGEATVVSSTPEPASLFLLGTALLAFAPLVRRRSRRV